MSREVYVGVDPGQRCGWGVVLGRDRVRSGVFDVRPKKSKKNPKPKGYWYAKFVEKITAMIEGLEAEGMMPYAIAIEKVMAHKGALAAHEYGAIVGLVKFVAFQKNLPVIMIPVGHIKRYATGMGNASKEAMIDAARAKWGFLPSGDDEADALWVAEAARTGTYPFEMQ